MTHHDATPFPTLPISATTEAGPIDRDGLPHAAESGRAMPPPPIMPRPDAARASYVAFGKSHADLRDYLPRWEDLTPEEQGLNAKAALEEGAR